MDFNKRIYNKASKGHLKSLLYVLDKLSYLYLPNSHIEDEEYLKFLYILKDKKPDYGYYYEALACLFGIGKNIDLEQFGNLICKASHNIPSLYGFFALEFYNHQSYGYTFKVAKEGIDVYNDPVCYYLLSLLYKDGLYVGEDLDLAKRYICIARSNNKYSYFKESINKTYFELFKADLLNNPLVLEAARELVDDFRNYDYCKYICDYYFKHKNYSLAEQYALLGYNESPSDYIEILYEIYKCINSPKTKELAELSLSYGITYKFIREFYKHDQTDSSYLETLLTIINKYKNDNYKYYGLDGFAYLMYGNRGSDLDKGLNLIKKEIKLGNFDIIETIITDTTLNTHTYRPFKELVEICKCSLEVTQNCTIKQCYGYYLCLDANPYMDVEKGKILLQEAIDEGALYAYYWLGFVLYYGCCNSKEDIPRAAKLFQLGVDNGLMSCRGMLGVYHYYHGDRNLGYKYLIEAAKNGSIDAKNCLKRNNIPY